MLDTLCLAYVMAVTGFIVLHILFAKANHNPWWLWLLWATSAMAVLVTAHNVR